MSVIRSDLAVESSTLVELLRRRALHRPAQRAYTFLLDGETEKAELTYGELDRRARAIGAALQELGAAGERALLLYPPGLDYIAAFFGCLYAGVVAVPAYPPDPARIDRTLPRLRAIVADARPVVTLTTAPILAIARALSAQEPAFQAMRWLATDALAADPAPVWAAPTINGATLAFLQYTSGSTAAPKGVMLTHANLLHNSALICRAFEHSAESVGVIWLPPYHDMGLIGGIIQPLYAGFPVVLLSPVDFLQRPLRWLQAITRYGATTSGGPNFAYDLCVRKVTPEQRAALDLSSWQVAFNGAEPLRAETLERFAATFAPRGFRRAAFYPCYGLAEATLIVSGAQATAPIVRTFQAAGLSHNCAVEAPADQADGRRMVSCGPALPGQQIAIVDPQTLRRCPPNQVGEVWVAGPSVAQGYWDQPDATARTFQASVAEGQAGPFLRTGDLGFLHDGELFIAGRLKDLIIVRGRNFYPQDIELTAERSHPALRPGSGAAFAVEVGGEERLVVVQEAARDFQRAGLDEVAEAVRRAVAEQHELHVYAVVLLKPGSIPKTSSGKIQRYACRERFLEGSLDLIASSVLDEPAPVEDEQHLSGAALLALAPAERGPLLAAYLRERLARVLRVAPSQLDPLRPISALGLDSLMAVELQHAVEADLGVVVPMVGFLQAATIAQLADEILARLLADPAPAALQSEPAGAAPLAYPLSFGQRALWFLHQLAPASAAYAIARAVRLRGELDAGALRRAFQSLIDRHAALRTTFAARDGEPAQVVHERADVCFAIVDAASWSAADLDDRLSIEAAHPFELEHGPLLRVSLFVRSAREHVLLLVAHHLVADLWSMVVLTHELGLLYAAEQAGMPAALGRALPRYADYVRWQADLLAGVEGQRLWAYWQRRLGGAPLALDLPSDRPRPPVQTYRGTTYTFRLSAALAGEVKALARDAEATLYMTLLAAFQALLYRYTGQSDLLVGTATTGRSRAEWAHLVGYFVNPIVLRADLSGDPTFVQLLGQVRQTVLEALAHQDYPFALLVERLQPERDPSRSPLFQVMFVVQKAQMHDDAGLTAFALEDGDARMRLGGLEVESIALEQHVAQFDLTLALAAATDGLAGSLQYNADLFDAATIARMAGHLQTLLEGIAADPRRRLAELPLLTAAERAQLLVAWNATAADFPRDRCVHELFAAQAVRAPDAVAVVFDGRTTTDHRPPTTDQRRAVHPFTPSPLHPFSQHLTYHELNARANQLAHYLQQLGVEPEVTVALCIERSPELVVGLLGVLKAGGAYVPLDPAYPPERLAFMLEDSRAAVLITQHRDWGLGTGDWERGDKETEFADDVTPSPPHPLTLSGIWSAIAARPPDNPACRTRPENLAYVIYTSGSTGQPKGVQIEHRGLLNLACWHRGAFDVSPRDRATQIAEPAFDAMVWEIWPYLTAGASIHIPAEETRIYPARLRDWLVARAITVCFLPTPLAEQVLFLDWPAGAALRALLTGGDTLRHYPPPTLPFALVNNYGPTESSVVTTSGVVLPAGCAGGPPAIGRPIANAQVYLLDGALQPVPVGLAGELYIGGDGLARGYLNRPDLTAERFIPHPFGKVLGDRCWVTGDASSNTQHPTPNTRLYKTGDLARYRPDGNIEYLGRLDEQIKLRGYRIELGEIEATLLQHPGVRAAVVVVREDAPGEARLVAYLVTSHKSQVTSSADSSLVTRHLLLVTEVRGFLKTRLPAYMIPSAIVPLVALPLTPSGKLDRRALPAPEPGHAAGGAPYSAPRTPTEAALAGIWAELLQLSQVGIDDNFFALGGHSLLAARIVAQVRERFGLELPIHCLFEAPTVAGLAARVEAARRDTAAAPPSLQPVPRDAPSSSSEQALPLSYAQQRLWLLDRMWPGCVAYNVPAALRLSGHLDAAALRRSLQTIVGRHEVLRTTFTLVDGQPAQLIARNLALPLPVVDLRGMPEQAREAELLRLAAQEARRPFDLARGPLLRATLLWLAPDEHVLLLTVHHIVADGASMGVFMRELAACYGAAAARTPVALPALPIQYADYAVWQRAWLQGSGVGGQGSARQGDTETRRHGDTEIEDRRSKIEDRGSTIFHPPSSILHPPSPIEAQLAYWRRQLADLPVLELPTDHLRPATLSFRGAVHSFTLPASLHAALVALCQREETTLFMALLAAFAVQLSRYSGQDDIVVGTPIDNRSRSEVEGLIGFFVNTLVLRTDLSGAPSFREVLRRVRTVAQAAYAHQDLPFEMLVEELRPERDMSRTPLFQVMFVFQNFPALPREMGGLLVQPLDSNSGTAKFDLMLLVDEREDALVASFEYTTDLFEPTTIGRMVGHFQNLLEALATDLDLRIDALPLLTEAERRQLLVEWNATAADFPRDLCIHQLFEAQVARTPDTIALVFDRPPTTDHRPPTADHRLPTSPSPLHPFTPSPVQCLTYHELNARANRLAHHLRSLGVGPEVRVALYLERSLELMVAILGVLKAGGAYVPLDPTYPSERLAFMVEDAQVAVLLTTTAEGDKETRPAPSGNEGRQGDKVIESAEDVTPSPLHPFTPSPLHPFTLSQRAVICLDADWPTIAAASPSNPGQRAMPDNLAYVLFTSGSTGRPKGVCCCHSGVINLLDDFTRRAPLAAGDHGSLWTSLSFDVSVYEIFSTLLAGGALYIVPEAVRADSATFIGWLEAHAIHSAYLPPFMIEALAARLRAGPPLALRRLLVGVEPIKEYTLADISVHIPGLRIVNGYGPTEATICATLYDVQPGEAGDGNTPIGRPAQNTQVYVLDSQLQLVPVGVAGELYIGGAGLARGYLNRPDLTAERFIPNPFPQGMGDKRSAGGGLGWGMEDSIPIPRLYRTGDLVRYRPDGSIMFLGRADQQVKLRGYRVELGEIEAVLREHLAVREAVALVREDGMGEARLVAYVVQGSGVRGQGSEDAALIPDPRSLIPDLRGFLQARLPAYMVPAAFVELEALPLTPSGKLDRRALPAPDSSHMAGGAPYVAPRTSIEAALAGIWAELLQLPQVGVDDNFFALGGHSLLAARAIARACETFEVELPLQSLFEAPTVAGLAEYIEMVRWVAHGRQTVHADAAVRDEGRL